MVCNVWGTRSDLQRISSRISWEMCRRWPNDVSLFPVEWPMNCALCFMGSRDEIEKAIQGGPLDFDSSGICLWRWAPKISVIPISKLSGAKWIKVWGLSPHLWLSETLQQIRELCGGLLQVDQCTNTLKLWM